MGIIGVDTGGTFTDLVLVEGDDVRVEKLSSTPDDPSRAVLEGVSGFRETEAEVVHGTTVALNALLTGRTARCALVTNEGFRDLIEIGRQDRPALYALHPEKPRELVPRELRFELAQRSAPGPSGAPRVERAPSAEALGRLERALADADVESIAICLLHSYADPGIETDVASRLESLGVPLSLSARILPEYREYERFSTAVVNAALVPLMRRYLSRLGGELLGRRLDILQSSGGRLPAERAAEEPVRVLFSGPAGGVVGAARAAREAGFDALVALDMGGTSTDVAFHSGEAQTVVTETRIAGHPIGVPSLDIHTIGTGGGSKVRVDPGGILHVGPESAAADPGPVCYGTGEDLTVTDAHVLLGHIATGTFASGRLELDVDRVAQHFERLAKRLGVKPKRAAAAVLDVARAAMRRALGVMTMQRGQDPERLPLVAFGGAGGLHAAALAGSLSMPGALVPRNPGVLSAWGMATADATRDRSRTVLSAVSDWPASQRKSALRELFEDGASELFELGHSAREIEREFALDLRYKGQTFVLRLADPGGAPQRVIEAFHARHEALYGWRLDARQVELVNLRARAVVRSSFSTGGRVKRRALPKKAVLGERKATFERALKVPRIDRAVLSPGHHFSGPALVEEFSGTTLVPPGWHAEVRSGGHLWLSGA